MLDKWAVCVFKGEKDKSYFRPRYALNTRFFSFFIPSLFGFFLHSRFELVFQFPPSTALALEKKNACAVEQMDYGFIIFPLFKQQPPFPFTHEVQAFIIGMGVFFIVGEGKNGKLGNGILSANATTHLPPQNIRQYQSPSPPTTPGSHQNPSHESHIFVLFPHA